MLVSNDCVSQTANYVNLACFGAHLQKININRTEEVFDVVVTVYDIVLTFPDEFRIMWKRPITGAKVLFFLNRYLFLVMMVIQTMSDNVSDLGYPVNLFLRIESGV